jgi:Cft2 family RNA processing exonuclease
VVLTPQWHQRRRVCRSYGDVLGSIVHGLFLSDFPSVRLRFDAPVPEDAHRARFDTTCSYLARAGFRVIRKFETPDDEWRTTGRFRLESLIRRPEAGEATPQEPLELLSYDDLVPQSIRLFISAAFARPFSLEARIHNPAQRDTLPLFEALCRSLGYRARRADWDGKSLALTLSRDSMSAPRWPLNEFLQANQWRVLVIFLNRLFPGGCEVCRPPRPRPAPSRPYRVEWCPIYRDDGKFGQLIAFDGFSDDDWKYELGVLGGVPVSDRPGSPIFVPSTVWGQEDCIRVFEPGSRDFRAFTRIRFPPPVRGLKVRLSKESESGGIPVSLTPLGGGQEIGANSYLVKVGTRNLLLDCGFNVGFDPYNPLGLPHIEAIDQLDAVVLSHAHTDHVGSILMLHSLFPTVPIYCTPETGALTRVTIAHHSSPRFRHLQEESLGVPLPPIREWGESFERALREVPFNQTVPLGRLQGITLRFLPAGHILGAAFTELVAGSTKLLYTGDFCSRDQLTINKATIPEGQKWDAVITESTNARRDRSIAVSLDSVIDGLGATVSPVIENGGIVLLPSFALGKAQEVYALVMEARRRHFSRLSRDRIWVGGLARQFFPAYSEHSEHSASLLPAEPPELPDVDIEPGGAPTASLKRDGPGIVIATSGMLMPQTYSHAIAEDLLKDQSSALILTGYQAPNTLGDRIKKFIDQQVAGRLAFSSIEHRSLTEGRVQVRAALDELRISGHATYDEIIGLLRKLDPKKVVAVHGDPSAARTLLNGLLTELPLASLQAPANLETVSLGTAAISEEAIASWKALPSYLPQIPARRNAIRPKSPIGRQFRGWDVDSDSDRARVERGFPMPEGCSRAHEVLLDPATINAEISLFPPDRFSMGNAEQLDVSRQDGTSWELIRSLTKEQLSALSRERVALTLPPGRYFVETLIQGQTVKQSLDVRLDFDFLSEIEFDEEGNLEAEVATAGIHLDNFSKGLVVGANGTPVEGVPCRVLSTGSKLWVHLMRDEPPNEDCYLQLEFRNGYPISRAELAIRGFPTPDSSLITVNPDPPVGTAARFRIRRPGYRITDITAEGEDKGIFRPVNVEEGEIRFVMPGRRNLNVETQDKSGRFHHQKATLTVRPAVTLDPGLQAQLGPGTLISTIGRIEVPSDWARLSVIIGDTVVASSLNGSLIQIQYRTPEGPPRSIPFAVQANHRTGDLQCTLVSGKLSVGLGETMLPKESQLATRDGRGYFTVRKRTGFSQKRISAIEASLAGWAPAFQVDQNDTRLRISFSIPQSDRHRPVVNIPYGGFAVLNVDKIEVEVAQRGRKAADTLKVGVETEIKIPDFVRGKQGSATPALAFYRIRPFLEWISLTKTSESVCIVDRVSPGTFRLALVHLGQLAWFRDFVVSPLPGSLRVVPPPNEPALKSVAHENFLDYARDFLGRNSGVPPPVIGVGQTGSREIFSGPNLTPAIRGFLSKHAGRGLIFLVLPGNHLTIEVSKALFESEGKWVALSYPSLREPQPTEEAAFVAANLHSPDAASGRIHERRLIRAQDCLGWSPTMRIPCPSCTKPLRVDLIEGKWRSYCECGFESTNVSYSLKDLKSGPGTIFVLQFQMFSWLSRNWSPWIGDRLGASLRCEVCGYRAPFRNMQQFEATAVRMRGLVPGHIPRDLRYFVDKGLWKVRKQTYEPSGETFAIAKRRCPKCCGTHLENRDCGHPSLTDEQRRAAVLLVGLEELAFPDYDPYAFQEDRFPQSEFPGLEGYSEPTDKLTLMLEMADRWWEEER